MTPASPKAYRLSVFFLLVSLMTCIYMLSYRAVMQSGDTLRALDAVTSLSRYGDWLMDESNWFKPSLRIREKNALPLSEYEVEERLNIWLALPLLKITEALPNLGVIHTVWLFNALVTALIVGMLYLLVIALGFSDAVAVLAAVSAGIGSNLWAYSQTFFREPLSAFFIVLALLALQLGRRRQLSQRILSLAVAAACLYLAYLTKYSAALALPAAIVFALPEIRRLNRAFERRLTLAILAFLLALVAAPMLLDPLPEAMRNAAASLRLDSTYLGAALRSYVLSPGASIWGTSPILLLSLAGAALLWRQAQFRLLTTISLMIAGYVLGHALTTGPHWFGGLSWPPRFLLPAIPVLTLAMAPAAQRVLAVDGKRWRPLWGALMLYGVWIQFNGVALSWAHFGESLPAEAQQLSEWAPTMWQPAYFRWTVLPQRWADLGIDFLWTRANLPLWGLSFALLLCVIAATLVALLRRRGRRWKIAPLLLTPLCLVVLYLNLNSAYRKDPRTRSQQTALHEALAYLEDSSTPDDILLLPGNDYGNFLLNYQTSAKPRVIVLPRPLAQAASDRQPAEVHSSNPNDWFDVNSARAIRHVAARRDRIWLLANTSPFMSWSFRPLERYLAQHAYLLQELDFSKPDDTARLLEYSTVAPVFNPLSLYAGERAADLRFGENIALRSFVASNDRAYAAGDSVEFSLLWQTDAKLDISYTVATFIASADSRQPIAQGWDSAPQAGFAPTTGWRPGASVWDNRAIRLPFDAPPGDYRLWVLLYYRDNDSGEIKRLPVTGSVVVGDSDIGVLPFTLHLD
ncbi:MAG: phospholipid carrier-dependent glycosyltransferase [Chloroflexi bacterium]|nr:phospholipid carrier-dependent glycosyltransferase [Chloroflexota bacterium]